MPPGLILFKSEKIPVFNMWGGGGGTLGKFR